MAGPVPPVEGEGPAVLPHRDPTFDEVVRLLGRGPLIEWKLTGPTLVHDTNIRGADREQNVILLPGEGRPITVNLSPEIAAAVLKYLVEISDAHRSKRGKSWTLHKKKQPAERA